MFERYTEKARRVIFFARYEASQFGSEHIETEHLLLALFREDKSLRARVGFEQVEAFRKQVEATAREKISTAVDLPLSDECKRVLALASEEAGLRQEEIACGHLALGLLRLGSGAAAEFLARNGIDPETCRAIIEETKATPVRSRPLPAPRRPPKAAALAGPVAALYQILDQDIQHLDPDQRLKRKPWSRKEAMGRLVDLATAHHQWLARALTEPKAKPGWPPLEEWVAAQQYASYDWRELISLWLLINRLVMHVMCVMTEETAARCDAEIKRYVAECEDLVGQILAKLG